MVYSNSDQTQTKRINVEEGLDIWPHKIVPHGLNIIALINSTGVCSKQRNRKGSSHLTYFLCPMLLSCCKQ